jgi:hypothetical protein
MPLFDIVGRRKKQHFFNISFLDLVRSPTPPLPGPLTLKEIRELQAAAAPPLIIRTRAPREKPPPIIIRESPPHAPQLDTNPQYVTRIVRHTGSSYSSPPQQQQQYQHYRLFNNGTVNYDRFNGIQNGINHLED